MMTISNTVHFLESSGTRSFLGRARRYLRGRRGFWLVAGLALGVGLAFKWNWLVAAGIAPVIVSLLPCAAMCALGLCAHKMSSSVAVPKPPSAGTDADSDPKS